MLLAEGTVFGNEHTDYKEDLRNTEMQFLVAVDDLSRVVEEDNRAKLVEGLHTARKRLRDMFIAREQQMLAEESLLRDAYRLQHRLVLRTLEHLKVNLELGIPEAAHCMVGYLRSL